MIFFKWEASNFQWILENSFVLFTLTIFQWLSEARKKLLAFKWVLYLFQQVIFVNKQIKLKEFQSLENEVCHARHCIGCKWPMDQMCSKCKMHCFSHKLWKFSRLQKISSKYFLSKFDFFKEFFFLTEMFFSDNFFQRMFHCFQDHYTVLK